MYPGATEICDGKQNDCDAEDWSEAGLAEWIQDGERTDVSAIWSEGLNSGAVEEITLDTAGTLALCEGTWYASVEITADIDIRGYGAVLSGRNQKPLITARTPGTSVWLTGLELRDGFAVIEPDLASTGGQTAGGAVFCAGATVQIDDTLIADNAAVGFGGGLLAQECEVELNDVVFDGNSVSAGGGGALALDASVVTVDGAAFSNSTTLGLGNHFFLGEGVTLEISDATVDSGDRLVFAARGSSDSPNHVTLRDTTFADADEGIYDPQYGSLELDGVVVEGGQYLFYAEFADVTVTDSVFRGIGGYTLDVYDGSSLAVSGSTFGDSEDAVGITYQSSTSTIDGCVFTGNENALTAMVAAVDVTSTDFSNNDADVTTSQGTSSWGEGASFSCTSEGVCE